MVRATAFLYFLVLFTASVPAQQAQGKDVLARKCFQCHQASMWTSVRGDRTEWLGVLYRMVGRGAFWTEDEINAMADFLAQTRPPQNPQAQVPRPKAP
jgi:hypothetical protein